MSSPIVPQPARSSIHKAADTLRERSQRFLHRLERLTFAYGVWYLPIRLHKLILLHPVTEFLEVSTYTRCVSHHIRLLILFIPDPAIEGNVSRAHDGLTEMLDAVFYICQQSR